MFMLLYACLMAHIFKPLSNKQHSHYNVRFCLLSNYLTLHNSVQHTSFPLRKVNFENKRVTMVFKNGMTTIFTKRLILVVTSRGYHLCFAFVILEFEINFWRQSALTGFPSIFSVTSGKCSDNTSEQTRSLPSKSLPIHISQSS